MQYNSYKPNNLYGFTDDIIDLKQNDTFNSLFGNSKLSIDTTKLLQNPAFKQLNKKYKTIFDAGRQAGLYDGEIQMLIYLYSDGKSLHEIELRRFEDLISFLKLNIDKLLSFAHPELHAFLLRTKYYKKDKSELIKPHRMARVAKIIKALFNDNNSKTKLIKFSEILSRL